MPSKPPTFKPRFTAPPASADQLRGSSGERGYDSAWRRLRAAKLTADPVCELEGPTCTLGATLVDHKKPITAGGERLDWSNLRSCCRACHAVLTANYRRTGVNELPQLFSPKEMQWLQK